MDCVNCEYFVPKDHLDICNHPDGGFSEKPGFYVLKGEYVPSKCPLKPTEVSDWYEG